MPRTQDSTTQISRITDFTHKHFPDSRVRILLHGARECLCCGVVSRVDYICSLIQLSPPEKLKGAFVSLSEVVDIGRLIFQFYRLLCGGESDRIQFLQFTTITDSSVRLFAT